MCGGGGGGAKRFGCWIFPLIFVAPLRIINDRSPMTLQEGSVGAVSQTPFFNVFIFQLYKD